jgi:hypothetical protein
LAFAWQIGMQAGQFLRLWAPAKKVSQEPVSFLGKNNASDSWWGRQQDGPRPNKETHVCNMWKVEPTREEKCAGRRGVSYVSCHSAEINPGIHENGKYMVGVHFQMTATSNNDICIALSLPNANELHFASTCRAPCSALSEPRHMNRKLTSSHGTHRRWEKFGSGDTMESTSSEEEISRARVSLASAYPLKCMKVDAQHFPWV